MAHCSYSEISFQKWNIVKGLRNIALIVGIEISRPNLANPVQHCTRSQKVEMDLSNSVSSSQTDSVEWLWNVLTAFPQFELQLLLTRLNFDGGTRPSL